MSLKPLIIAVDGRSGSGKTTLATELAELLRTHLRVSLFHLEDIYPGWSGLAAGQQRYLDQVLTPLAAGVPAHWTAWDWAAGAGGGVRRTEPADVVILEGVGAGFAAARQLIDVLIWVEAGAEDRRQRALERDGEGYRPYWELWAAQEDSWLAGDRVREAAQLLIQAPAAYPAGPGMAQLVADELAALWPARAVLGAPHRPAPAVHIRRIEGSPDPAVLFRLLYGSAEHAVLLESSDHGTTPAPARSRFSIMADDGGRHGRLFRHEGGVSSTSHGPVTVRSDAGFFRWLAETWDAAAPAPAPIADGGAAAGYECPFRLGWLGYLGYELKRETGGSGHWVSPLPDAQLIHAGQAAVVDHEQRCTYLLWLSSGAEDERWAGTAAAAVAQGLSGAAAVAQAGPALPELEFRMRDGRAAYLRSVRAAQDQIAEGNSYEVCLTTTLHASTGASIDPFSTYVRLRSSNPAPFTHYLRFGTLAVASTSPERFLSISADGALRAEPIKGTRARAADPVQDTALRRELAASTKDRAENIMIVDLLRNDLSHYAEPGSLRVSRLCAVESYATVHQLVSTIDARLLPQASRAEAIAAAFPAGSMTGAPKVSTMAILDTLESGPRGIYSGAAGYFSLDGAADLSVVIRTLVLEATAGGTELSLGVGGAITSDSVPADEWEEVRTKAYGVLSALGSRFPGSEQNRAGPSGTERD